MKKIDILDFNNFVAFEELANVNVVKINELPFFDETSALTVKVQRGSEELPRVEVAEADVEGSIGSFTIDNNQLIFVINKNIAKDDDYFCKIKKLLQSFKTTSAFKIMRLFIVYIVSF